MSSIDGFCKHGAIARNCYSCHIDKTELDTLHETISELKVRVSKLEEYKRLQDDLNKMTDHQLENLHRHRLQQIDENRAVSKHLTQLETDNSELNSIITDVRFDLDAHISLSDCKTKKTGLTFEEAMTAFKGFKTIRREGWSGCFAYCLKDKPLDDTISFRDMLMTDWEIIG